MSRPLLTVVATTPEEEREVSANHATWKFDLFATVAGDPLCHASCVSVIVAYSNFCSAKDRTAYLSEIDLQVRTGGLDPRTLRKAKRRLVDLGYLTPIGKTSARIVLYRLANPRKDLVDAHRVFAAEKLREDEAFQKEEDRRRYAMRGNKNAPPKINAGGAEMHLTGGADMHPNTVENSVERYLYEGGDHSPHDARGGFRNEWSIPMDGSWPPLRGEVDR